MLKAPPGDEILQALGAVGENDAEHEPMKGLGEGVMGCKLYLWLIDGIGLLNAV